MVNDLESEEIFCMRSVEVFATNLDILDKKTTDDLYMDCPVFFLKNKIIIENVGLAVNDAYGALLVSSKLTVDKYF